MPTPPDNKPGPSGQATGCWVRLGVYTAIALACYLTLLVLGPGYDLPTPPRERPMRLVIGVYAFAFLPCWLATYLASRTRDSRALVGWILGTSVLFRLVMLPTPPFQEIDIYRYLWDGAVVASGENPYRYALDEIKNGIADQRAGRPLGDPRLERLARKAIEQPGLEKIVNTVHYAHLPSPYPPVSQAVFAAPALATPAGWSAAGRLNMLKTVLTLFDLGTLLLVLELLRRTGLPRGLAVAYGWCPLVIKEVAGSGHLDSIATFFAVAGLTAGVIGLSAARSSVAKRGLAASAGLLALGVGGKLFPVVLAPLMCFAWGRRGGWASAAVWAFLFCVFSGALLAPMLAGRGGAPPPPGPPPAGQAEGAPTELPPAPGTEPDAVEGVAPTAGLSAFLSSWEMNDLAFMIVLEHLRSHDHLEPRYQPWFVIWSKETCEAITGSWVWLTQALGIQPPGEPAFVLARVLTLTAFGLIAVVLAWRATDPRPASSDPATPSGPDAGSRLLRAAFLTLAWFWLLAPTQNPWYWCWAVPLLPFARLRAWHLLAACSLLYYSRFWLEAHFPRPAVLETPYDGPYFFYFVVVWVEFLPWLLLLAAEAWLRSRGPAARPPRTAPP